MLYVRDERGKYVPAEPDAIINEAKLCIAARFKRGIRIDSPKVAAEALLLQLADYEHEVFACLFLDNGHHIIQFAELFRGTIDGANVYPREVVKAALACNAAAVIFAHNHPSGLAEPSQADKAITEKLKQALALVDVRVIDHFVIGGDAHYSFAEHKLLG